MTGDEPWLDRAIDELYAGDLDRFTPRRTELAKEAKTSGDKEASAAITALRKPTQSAFTINRLARTDPSSIEALVEVGDQLRRAQRSADGKQLRELNSQRRKLLDSLTRRAFEIIGQQSPSAGQREEVNATLTAALADSGVADQLRQGILVRAAESSGFGFSPPELTLIRSPRPATSEPAPEKDAVHPRKSGSTNPSAPTRTRSTVTAKDDGDRAQDGAAAKTAAAAEKSAVEKTAAEKTAAEKAQAEKARQSRAEAEQQRRDAAIEKAQSEAEAADAAVHGAVADIDGARQLIRLLQRQLTEAKKTLEDSQANAKAAEGRQRKAREALNKARG